jgi:uncharacterized protein
MPAVVTMDAVNEFLSCRTIALAGASRSGGKFGNSVLRALMANGYRVIPVHPSAPSLEGLPCVTSPTAIHERIDGLVTVVPPKQTEALVREAGRIGISRVWMQQGSESADAVEFCAAHGIREVHGECLIMFLGQSGGLHRFHHWVNALLGRLPP